MIDLLLSCAIFALMTGIGLLMLRCTIKPVFHSVLEAALFGCAVGFGLTAYLFLLLGVLRLYYPLTAWLMVLCALVVLALFRRQAGFQMKGAGGAQKGAPFSIFEIGILVIFIVFVTVNLVNSAVPTINHDTLRDYFVFPKTWIQHHGQTGDFPRNCVDNFTLVTGLINAFGMLLSGEVLAQMLTGFSMGILCALAVYRLARNYFHRGVALLAATIFYSSRIIVWISPSGKINLCCGFFEILIVYSFFRWLDSPEKELKRKWLLIAALVAGIALSVHTAALLTITFISLFLFIAMLFRDRIGFRKTVAHCLLFGCLAMVIGSPLYLKNLVITGNPFFPRLRNLFGGEYSGISYKLSPIAFEGLKGYFLVFWWNTMEAIRNISQPPSPLLLALVPGVILIKRPSRVILIMLIYCVCFSIPWFAVCQRNRYMLTVFCALSITSAYVFYSLAGKGRPVLSVALPLALLFSFRGDIAVYAKYFLFDREKVLCALNIISQESYLDNITRKRTMIPNYAMCRFVNEHLPGEAKIFAVHDEFFFRMDRPYICSRQPVGERIMYVKDERELLGLMRDNGITHVLDNETYVQAINAWFRKVQGWQSYLPEDNLFSRQHFRDSYLISVYKDENEHLYRIWYPGQLRP